MKRIASDLEVIHSVMDVGNRTILDVGCGTGTLMRGLISKGATSIGLDSKGMLKKALVERQSNKENYIVGGGEALCIKSGTVDLVVFIASLHHIPKDRIMEALGEARRVLTKDGRVIILEPVGLPGSYFELVRLIEDEREIQEYAYQVIKNSTQIGLKELSEEMFYLARTFNDYTKLLQVFVESDEDRNHYLEQARKITDRMSRKAGKPLESYVFKSICRVNVLCG